MLETKTILNYENCINNGDIVGTSSIGYLYGNSAYIDKTFKFEGREDEINITNCKNNGVLSSTMDNARVEFAPQLEEINNQYQESCGGSYISSNILKNQNIYINQDGTNFTINQVLNSETGITYKLIFNISAIYSTQDGLPYDQSDIDNINSGEWSESCNVSNGIKYKNDLTVDSSLTTSNVNAFKALDKRTAITLGIIDENTNLTYSSDGYAIFTVDDTSYLIFNTTSDIYINSNVSLMVYAYNASGVLIGNANVK